MTDLDLSNPTELTPGRETTPSQSRAEIDRLVEAIAGPRFLRSPAHQEEFRERQLKLCQYTKMLPFTLMDSQARAYRAERWCFRGSIDNWIPLPASGALAEVVGTYAKHLDRESFFELM